MGFFIAIVLFGGVVANMAFKSGQDNPNAHTVFDSHSHIVNAE